MAPVPETAAPGLFDAAEVGTGKGSGAAYRVFSPHGFRALSTLHEWRIVLYGCRKNVAVFSKNPKGVFFVGSV